MYPKPVRKILQKEIYLLHELNESDFYFFQNILFFDEATFYLNDVVVNVGP